MAKDQAALAAAVSTIERTHGKNAIMTLGAPPPAYGEDIVLAMSTGSLGLDLATGIGGYPKGRVVEIYGPEASGKTTLALHAIAAAQRAAGGAVALIDMDHTFDVAYARAVGVIVEKLLVSQPDTGEQAFDIAEVLTRSGAVDLVVFDSVPNLAPRAELEGEIAADDVGLRARLMSQTLRKLTAIAHRTGSTVLFVNRLKKAGASTYGDYGSAGSNALKFYASMRIDVRRIGFVADESTVATGPLLGRTQVKIAKNKCAPPFTQAEFSILYAEGIDTAGELLDLGVACGVIGDVSSGSAPTSDRVYMFGGVSLGRDREGARSCLRVHADIAATLRQAILATPTPGCV